MDFHQSVRLHTRILCLILLSLLSLTAPAQNRDSEKLGRALEYFKGEKYHEAMLLLEPLHARYKLNPRFIAYLGVCYHHEREYRKATQCLDTVIPLLRHFSPAEQALYHRLAAESHEALKEHAAALACYRSLSVLCKEEERAEIYTRIARLHRIRKEWVSALDNFQNALVLYKKQHPEQQEQIKALRDSIEQCCQAIKNNKK